MAIDKLNLRLFVRKDFAVPFPRSYWVLPHRLLAGYYPGGPDPHLVVLGLRALLEYGISLIVNLMHNDETDHHGITYSYYDNVLAALAAETRKTVACIHIPIADLGVPSRNTMQAILDEIDKGILRNHTVYVHCLGGKGRTGMVIGCYLARHGLAAGLETIEMIKMLRQRDPIASQASPETYDQRSFVISWNKGE